MENCDIWTGSRLCFAMDCLESGGQRINMRLLILGRNYLSCLVGGEQRMEGQGHNCG